MSQAAVRTPVQSEAPDIETSSEGYASRFRGEVGGWFLARQAQAVLSLAAGHGVKTVLDVGGGHAQIAGPLADAGYEVTVFGSDPVCAARLQPLLAAGRCRFDAGDLRRLPYPDQSFDLVVSLRLLPHAEAWPALIAELARVARRAVIVDYPTARSLNGLLPWLFEAKRRAEGNTRTYITFLERDVAQAFARHGLRPAGRVPQFCWPMVAHRVLKQPAVSRLLEAPCRLSGLTAAFGSPVVAAFAREAA
jgi:SAM-dependent methyltransferase